MVAVAPILLPASSGLDLPVDVREELSGAWASWWEPLRSELGSVPFPMDSSEERRLLARFARSLLVYNARFGEALAPALRSGISQIFEQLLEQEEAQAAGARRFGLKLLGYAVQVFGELFEAAAAAIAAAPEFAEVSSKLRLPDSDAEMAAALDPASVAVFRLELSLFVAFDLAREGKDEDFRAWAKFANVAARRASPYARASVAHVNPMTDELSADIVLDVAAHERLVTLVEKPPSPSTRLRSLMRRGTT